MSPVETKVLTLQSRIEKSFGRCVEVKNVLYSYLRARRDHLLHGEISSVVDYLSIDDVNEALKFLEKSV